MSKACAPGAPRHEVALPRCAILFPMASLSAAETAARGDVVATELFNDWGGRGYNDSVSVEVAKTVPSGDRTT